MAPKIEVHQERESWLESRRLGASSAYQAIAEPLALWAEMTGRVEGGPPPGMELRFACGHALEPFIHDRVDPLLREEYGYGVWDPGDYTNFVSRKRSWMTSTPDRFLVPVDANWKHRQTKTGIRAMLRQAAGHVEFKTVSEFATNGYPPYGGWTEPEPATGALLQTQHTLEVLEKDLAFIVALVGFSKLWVYRVERHQALIDRIVELEDRFMDHVVQDEMPPADESARTIAVINALYRQDDGTEMNVTESSGPSWAHLKTLFNKVEEYRTLEKHSKDRKAEWESKVKMLMGEAQKLTIEDHGEFIWKTNSRGARPLRLRRYEE